MRPFSNMSRRRRTRRFVQIMNPKPGEKVLDVGGQPQIWDLVEVPLNITCLNLPGVADTYYQSQNHHSISYLEGDACNMPEIKNGDFDMVFSNSVIEHVGDASNRARFACEVRRVSNRYWVQTPHKHFPIEAHCGMPFWWFYPHFVRAALLKRWRKKLPAWTDMIEGTSVVEARELKQLFPQSNMLIEWAIFPKSLVVYSKE